jgi:hypothetical protein
MTKTFIHASGSKAMANLAGVGLVVWVRRKKALRFEGLAVVSMVG